MTERETAYAKINLALHVRRRRSDGYHDLESLFAFAQDGDELSADRADTLSLAITGPFAEGLSVGEDNLVMRAAFALRTAFDVSSDAAIHLQKTLPVASGIGGGSADAAAALRMLSRLWEIDVSDPKVAAIARSLGADVPACLLSRTVQGSGRGDDLVVMEMPALTGLPLLLVNPRIPLSTAPVFAGWDGVDHGPLNARYYRAGRNDLTPSAIALVPEIGALIAKLAAQPGVTIARMSGSGATCFALFESDAARDNAAVQFQDEWTLCTHLR
jgi:4-diphosphocytidyl-2-C-methyl-D-erythritol kinase